MDANEMERRFKAAITDLGLNADQAQALGASLVQTEKDATAQGIAFKSEVITNTNDTGDYLARAITTNVMPGQRFKASDGEYIKSPSELDPTGEYYAVKAMPPMVPDEPAAEAKDDAPMEAMTEEVIEPDAEMDDGDYIGDMSVDEFFAKLSELLAPVLKMQDMHKGMTDALGEMKAMYGGVATKDAGTQAEIVALKARLAQIESDQPSTILPDEVASALKSAGPIQAQEPERPQIESTPERPWKGWAALTFPELYQNGENA